MSAQVIGKHGKVSSTLLALGLLLLLGGCSRRFWRQQAERDTYEAVTDKLNDPHWAVPRIDLTPDRRSRFHDPFDPDCEPLPPDDPAAHQTMHCVSGRRGYKNWHKLGTSLSIENPHWLEPFGVLMENADPVHGHQLLQVEDLTLEQAMELTYIHSRDYQTAIEDLYLTALAVTEEQFALGVRYAGPGVPVPGFTAGATDTPAARDTAGLSPRLGVTQLLPAGTQIAVELANNTLWLFGGGTSSSASTLAFSLTQPLLFRAGRKVILEALTQAERNVLYSARDLARFRQVLFTGITTDFLRIQQQLQAIRNQESNIRRLEEQIEIRRATDREKPDRIPWDLARFPDGAEIPDELSGRLSWDELTGTLSWFGPMDEADQQAILAVSDDAEYQATAAQLIRQFELEVTTLPAAELLTRLNNQKNQLENARRQLADLTDAFKISMGLPPNMQLGLDDEILDQFTLIDPSLLQLEDDFRNLIEEQGPRVIRSAEQAQESAQLLVPEMREFLTRLSVLRDRVGGQIQTLQQEFGPVEQLLEDSHDDQTDGTSESLQRVFASAEERARVQHDVEQDRMLFSLIQQDFRKESELLDIILTVCADEHFPGSLDRNGDDRIGLEELPSRWGEVRRKVEQRRAAARRRAGIRVTDDTQPADGAFSYDEIVLEARDGMTELRETIVQVLQSLQVVQADLRVEQIAVNRFTLPGQETPPDIDQVVEIGLSRRHDLMNARAEVMDARRRMEVAASELEATLDVTLEGAVGTRATSRKPFDFSGDAARYNAGLAFDTPADKNAERNVYNATLIEYQRARRAYMAVEDAIKLQIRESWRQLQVSEQQLEVDRQAVRTAGQQLDIAATNALGAGQQNALSLLNALDAVLTAQNSLLSDWITYEVNRLNIYRDMGIMQLDDRGMWLDDFYVAAPLRDASAASTTPSPPAATVPPPAAAETVPASGTDDGNSQ